MQDWSSWNFSEGDDFNTIMKAVRFMLQNSFYYCGGVEVLTDGLIERERLEGKMYGYYVSFLSTVKLSVYNRLAESAIEIAFPGIQR